MNTETAQADPLSRVRVALTSIKRVLGSSSVAFHVCGRVDGFACEIENIVNEMVRAHGDEVDKAFIAGKDSTTDCSGNLMTIREKLSAIKGMGYKVFANETQDRLEERLRCIDRLATGIDLHYRESLIGKGWKSPEEAMRAADDAFERGREHGAKEAIRDLLKRAGAESVDIVGVDTAAGPDKTAWAVKLAGEDLGTYSPGSIGWAVNRLNAGERVMRRGWNGKGMYLFRLPGGSMRTPCPETVYEAQPYVAMKTADNTVVPWLCSQSDLLAHDWEIFEG